MSALQTSDPELYELIQAEQGRQLRGYELIASENYTSDAVLECLGSVLTNKYAEGLPDKRYYAGNEYIDQIEKLCIRRALDTFGLSTDEWGVNVQPYSGSVANLAAYNALLKPHDRLMGLDLPSGGHLTHGYYTAKKKISATSIFWESLPYRIAADGYIDYDELESTAGRFLPKLIIIGASAYPRDYDYARFRVIADKVGAYLLCDMAHFSGLVATRECNNPFEYCDVVTTTTHKTLRGPRSGMIFFKCHLADQVNQSVFPAIQGGPHEHQIAAVATQLLQVQTPEFKIYIQQVKANAQALATALQEHGYTLSSGGTDNHLVLVNLRDKGITGSKIEKICERVGITINKNAVYGDTTPMNPGGIRLGTPYLTTMGLKQADFYKIADYIHQCVQIALEIQQVWGKKLVDFVAALETNQRVQELRMEILG